jgi:hypothetical protein
MTSEAARYPRKFWAVSYGQTASPVLGYSQEDGMADANFCRRDET